MSEWFRTLGPVHQALLAGIFTWTLTALGAAVCFVAREVNRKLLSAMMGAAPPSGFAHGGGRGAAHR